MKDVYILPLLLALAHSQMDTEFCAKRFKPTHNTDTISVAEPPVYDDISMSVESTNDTDPAVGLVRAWYSHTYNLMQRTYKIGIFDEQVIIIPAKGIFLDIFPPDAEYRKCEEGSFEHSPIVDAFNIPDPKTHKLRMPTIPYMISSIQRSPPMFIRKTTIRGIPAQEWFICSYDENNVTQAAYVYFSDDGVVMPGSLGKVPLSLHYEELNGDFIFKGRYDFTMFVDKVNPKDKELEIPAGLYCKNKKSAKINMPQPPETYQFESILKKKGGTTLQYMKETSNVMFSIVAIDQETVGSKTITAYRTRTVMDFRTGLSYNINLSTGNCTVQKVPKVVEHKFDERCHGIGHFNKRAPFFNSLGDNFQYLGKHRYLDRDIEADVYTTKETIKAKKADIISTYWIASPEFLQQIGLKKTEFILLRYQTKMIVGDQVFISEDDIYHLTTDVRQADLFPDISACYNAGKEIYVDIVLKGHYKLLYARNRDDFQAAFGTAMLLYSGILRLIRVAGLRVTPADEGYTRVQFTLLDKPSIMGSSEIEFPEPGNDVIWSKLEHSLETSQFQVSVHNDMGHHIAKAVSYSRDFQDPATYNAKKAHLKAASDQGSRFSPGSMAGIGIGMLLLGLLAGFGLMKGVKRYMDKVPDHIGMQEFKNEA